MLCVWSKPQTAALARAGAIVVTSRTTARLLATDFGVPRHRIHVAEPGTEPARRSPGNQLGRVRVLAVGSVVRRKGYDVLIEALAGIEISPGTWPSWARTTAPPNTR